MKKRPLPAAYNPDAYTQIFVNHMDQSITVFEVHQAEVVFANMHPDLKVFCIRKVDMRAAQVTNVHQARTFLEGDGGQG